MKNIFYVCMLSLTANFVFAQPDKFVSKGIGGCGAMFFPTINPANDNEYYIACDMSQLFHTTDFGATYSQVHFSKLQVFNSSTYEFTSNPLIAYSIFNDGNAGYPVRTLDGGNTWQALPGDPLPGEQANMVRADYNNPDRFLLNYYGAIYLTNNRGASFSLVRKTANDSFGIILSGVFFDGNTIVIATNEGVFQSLNGGVSFTSPVFPGIPQGQVIWQLAGAKSGATTRFFCITSLRADTYNGLQPSDYYGFAKGVYSLDYAPGGTNTWISKSAGIDFTNDFVMFVGMAKNDVQTVYLAGNDNALDAPLVYKTTDAGASWKKVFKTVNNQNISTGWSGDGGDRNWSYGESCFGVAVAPNNANKAVFGDYGFVHKTSDGGATWSQGYVSAADQNPPNLPTPTRKTYHSVGLENTSCWQILFQDAKNFFAGYSDIRGARSVDGGESWGFSYTGNGGNSIYRIVKNPAANVLYSATSNIHDLYQSTHLTDAQLDRADAFGKVTYSTDGGANWLDMKVFNHPVFWLATDPNNQNTLYASVVHYGAGTGDGGVWVTKNANALGSATWTKTPNPPRTEGHPASLTVLNDGKLLATFSGRRGASGFTASSGVFLYDPATNAWKDVSEPGMLYWTKDVVVDPSDPSQNTWLVAVFSGFGGAPNGKGGLYKTTNRGASWIELTGVQFDRVTSVTFNPLNAAQAFLTTETQGLWWSANMGASTPAWTLATGYPFRQPERVFFNPYKKNEVWVTSFGNGLRVGNLTQTSVNFVEETQGWSVHPNPTADFLNVDWKNEQKGVFEIFDLTGRMIMQGKTSGVKQVIDARRLVPGVYFLKANGKALKFIKY